MFLNTNLDVKITTKSFSCYNKEDIKNYATSNNYILNQTLEYDEIIPKMIASNVEIKNNTKLTFLILSAIQLPVPIILFVFKLLNSEKFVYDFVENEFCDDENRNKKNRNEYDDHTNNSEEKSSFTENLRQLLINIFDYLCKFFDNSLSVFKMTCTLATMVFIFDGLQVSLIQFII